MPRQPRSADLGKDDKYWAEFGGTKWGQQDQEFSLRGGRLGLFELGFDWDQIWHLSRPTRDCWPRSHFGGVIHPPHAAALAGLLQLGARSSDIAARWDAARMFFKLTPTPGAGYPAEYTRTSSTATAVRMAFGSPGNNFYQILQPIDQTVHDFRLTGTWAREKWQLQFGYTLSIFQNDLNAVRADNPCSGAAATTADARHAGAAAPTTGQTSLAPDNMANTFTLAAA